MTDIASYQDIKIKKVIGKREDLPISSTRSTLISKVKSLLLRISGTPNNINSYGTAESSIPLTLTFSIPGPLATDGVYLYVCSKSISSAVIDKIDPSNFTAIHSTLVLSTPNISGCKIVGRKLYIVTYTSPAKVVKIDLDSFTVDSTISLSQDWGNCITSDGTDLYIGFLNAATTIISKVNIKTFTETLPVLDTGVGGTGASSLEIDEVYLYVTQLSDPTSVTRIILSSFTVDSTISFTGLSSWGRNSCIHGNDLYVVAFSGKIHKVDLNTFLLTSTLTTTKNYASGGAIGTTGTYLIVAGTPSVGSPAITYIDLATFTEYGIYDIPANNNHYSFTSDETFLYFGLLDGTVFRKYIQPTTPVDSRLIDNTNTNVSSISVDVAALQTDVGDASTSTLGSLYGIVGNPAAGQDLATRIGFEGAASLANKLTAARAGYLDNINQAGLLQVTAARAGYLDNLISTVTTGTYNHPNSTNETDALIFNAATQDIEVEFDLDPLYQTITIRAYSQVDGINYRVIPSQTQIVSPGVDCRIISHRQKNNLFKITMQSSVAEGVVRAIPYRYITDDKT